MTISPPPSPFWTPSVHADRRPLLLARGRVLSRPQIEEHLYSWGDTVESNAVEVYVHHLRKKLGQKIIVTMRGVGYFMPQEQE